MDRKIYVLCPGGFKTGGTELLHQLVFNLNQIGVQAKIVYTGDKTETPEAFKKYIDGFITDLGEISDNGENLLIVSETQIEYLRKFSNIKKAIWWLSVDNYEKDAFFSSRRRLYGFGSAVYHLISGKINTKKDEIAGADIHYCQSYYAISYLKEKFNVPESKIHYLSDYINDSYTENYKLDKSNREDVVLYNPKKGYKFTKKLISDAPDIKWKALENMTNEEVRNTLNTSKCYIDFGNHPGKDRFPREAAVCGCIVITGKRGSAAFSEDVPIPERFKFDEKTTDRKEIIATLRKALKDYSEITDEFEDYRLGILKEQDDFKKDVLKEFKSFIC